MLRKPSILFLFVLIGCSHNDAVKPAVMMQISEILVGTTAIDLTGTQVSTGLPIDQPITISFTYSLNVASVPSSVSLKNGNQTTPVSFIFLNNNKTISVIPSQPLSNNTQYTIVISNQIIGQNNETFKGFKVEFKTIAPALSIVSYSIGDQLMDDNSLVTEVPLSLSIVINFSSPINTQTISSASVSLAGPNYSTLSFSFSNNNKTVTITRSTPLTYLSKYSLTLTSDIEGANGETFIGISKIFYTTAMGHTSFPPLANDDALLDLIQQQTIKYFYDFGHPDSGMARERNSSGDVVTTGGSGFGLMAMIVGIQRGFIPRTDGIARFNKIVSFLETADRFHGAWPHWVNGSTGKVIPFSSNDDGADLVETSYMAQGLITVRQYLTSSDTVGNNLINRINTLWHAIEWDWFRQEDQKNVLYWHWSPDKGWIMNFPLNGYFEEQITYFMAAASPTHSIPKIVYTNGYGQNGGIKTGNTYTYNGESYVLPLGSPSPLFWVQYSYLGLDPHFSDDYANYWTQNVNATLINHAYCVANPKKFVGYGDNCWGLTASDNPSGYDAQSPTNDNGTITPTAALSSMPYTPTESMKALKFFYYTLGDRMWGQYGFYDAFNTTSGWTATSYLAIDQGPIVVMIENYRTQLLWNLFMSAPEVQAGKVKLGFN